MKPCIIFRLALLYCRCKSMSCVNWLLIKKPRVNTRRNTAWAKKILVSCENSQHSVNNLPSNERHATDWKCAVIFIRQITKITLDVSEEMYTTDKMAGNSDSLYKLFTDAWGKRLVKHIICKKNKSENQTAARCDNHYGAPSVTWLISCTVWNEWHKIQFFITKCSYTLMCFIYRSTKASCILSQKPFHFDCTRCYRLIKKLSYSCVCK